MKTAAQTEFIFNPISLNISNTLLLIELRLSTQIWGDMRRKPSSIN